MLEGLLRKEAPEVAFDHLRSDNNAAHSSAVTSCSVDMSATLFDRPSLAPSTISDMYREQQQQHPPIVSSNTSTLTTEEKDETDDLTSEVALLCLNAAGREPHYFGPSSALSFSRVLSATLRRPKPKSNLPGTSLSNAAYRAEGYDGHPRRVVPPSRVTGAMLSKAYFDNIHPQYPYLHRDTFHIWENEFMEAREAGDLADVSHLRSYEMAEAYYTAAQEHIEFVIQMDSLESIQAILSCAMYSIRSPVGASVWRLSGMALRHCIELGFHRSLRRRRRIDHLKDEMSKRVLWVAYDMDRAAAFTLGRPFGIMDRDIDVELPTDIDDSFITPLGWTSQPRSSAAEPATSMSGAIHIIKLRQIWSKIHGSLYSEVSSADLSAPSSIDESIMKGLRQELDEWYSLTPVRSECANQPLSVFSSRDWFNLAYSHSVLLLYRRHLMIAAKGDTADMGFSVEAEASFIECRYHAGEICLLYRKMYANSSVRYTWGSLHILFLAGITYFHCLWASQAARKATRLDDVYATSTACTMVLVIIAERWDAAVSYRDVFETLAARTTSMMCETCDSSRSETHIYPQDQSRDSQATLLRSPDTGGWMAGMENLAMPNDMEWFLNDFTGQSVVDSMY